VPILSPGSAKYPYVMKKLLFSGLLLLAASVGSLTAAEGPASPAFAQDTLKIKSPREVNVITTDSIITVNVEGAEDNPDYSYSIRLAQSATDTMLINESTNLIFSFPFTKKQMDKLKKVNELTDEWLFGDFCFGLGNAVNTGSDLRLQMRSSFEIMLREAIGYRYHFNKHISTSVGAGFGWRNYRLTGLNRFDCVDGYTTLAPYPEGADIKFSRVKIFSWMFPIDLRWAINKNVAVKAGPVINVNTYGSIRTDYKVDGVRCAQTIKNIHQTPVTVDALFQLTWDFFGVYVKYSPMRVLDKTYGPAFSGLSGGIVLMAL
jgi:hypothetical protein